jgi:RND family efflux transporter MFP subunit
MSYRSAALLVCLAALGAGSPVLAADGPEREIVEPRRFTRTIELEGRFAPRDAVEVSYDGEVYKGPLEVVDARGPRTVKKGEVLVQFDDEDAQRALHDAQREMDAARIRLARLQAETEQKQDARRRRLAVLEDALHRVEADLARWREHDKPMRIQQEAFGIEGMENRVKDQEEELEQLEKMYKEDDLTEETEEIVLHRARRSLDRMHTSLEFARDRQKELLEVTLPRKEEDLVRGVEDRKADLAGYRTAARADDKLDAIALDKAREELHRREDRLGDLQQDVDGLRLRSPADGYAVPGRFDDGNWHDVDALRDVFAKGGEVKAGQTLFTVVTPGNVKVLALVPEKDLLELKEGQTATVRPAVLDERALEAVVSEVLPLPSKGKCPVEISLRESDDALMPGQTAKVEIAWDVVPDAITVPAGATRGKDGKTLVWVVDGDDVAPRAIEVGPTADGRTLVLSGLESGETILVRPPEDKAGKDE